VNNERIARTARQGSIDPIGFAGGGSSNLQAGIVKAKLGS
jgi:hypothetical protein